MQSEMSKNSIGASKKSWIEISFENYVAKNKSLKLKALNTNTNPTSNRNNLPLTSNLTNLPFALPKLAPKARNKSTLRNESDLTFRL